jgi:hypothetical protein
MTMATWRGSAIDGQALQAPIEVVLDEPPGDPHRLTRQIGVVRGEGGKVGPSETGE